MAERRKWQQRSIEAVVGEENGGRQELGVKEKREERKSGSGWAFRPSTFLKCIFEPISQSFFAHWSLEFYILAQHFWKVST